MEREEKEERGERKKEERGDRKRQRRGEGEWTTVRTQRWLAQGERRADGARRAQQPLHNTSTLTLTAPCTQSLIRRERPLR